MSPSARHRESRDGPLGNVKTPGGTGKYVEYAIETIQYLRLIARCGYIVTMTVGVYRRMPETVPPYSDEVSSPSRRSVELRSAATFLDLSRRQ